MSGFDRSAETAVFYEDVEIGATYVTGRRTISQDEIRRFGELTGDMTPIHMDEDFCRNGPFGRPIAHGAFGMSLMSGLKSQLHLYDISSVAALGWKELRYRAPLLAGDTVHAEARYASKRLTRSDPTRGVVSEHVRLINQHGTLLTEGEFSIMLRTRAEPRSSSAGP